MSKSLRSFKSLKMRIPIGFNMNPKNINRKNINGSKLNTIKEIYKPIIQTTNSTANTLDKEIPLLTNDGNNETDDLEHPKPLISDYEDEINELKNQFLLKKQTPNSKALQNSMKTNYTPIGTSLTKKPNLPLRKTCKINLENKKVKKLLTKTLNNALSNTLNNSLNHAFNKTLDNNSGGNSFIKKIMTKNMSEKASNIVQKIKYYKKLSNCESYRNDKNKNNNKMIFIFDFSKNRSLMNKINKEKKEFLNHSTICRKENNKNVIKPNTNINNQKKSKIPIERKHIYLNDLFYPIQKSIKTELSDERTPLYHSNLSTTAHKNRNGGIVNSLEFRENNFHKLHNVINTPIYRKRTYEKGGKFNNVQTTFVVVSKKNSTIQPPSTCKTTQLSQYISYNTHNNPIAPKCNSMTSIYDSMNSIPQNRYDKNSFLNKNLIKNNTNRISLKNRALTNSVIDINDKDKPKNNNNNKNNSYLEVVCDSIRRNNTSKNDNKKNYYLFNDKELNNSSNKNYFNIYNSIYDSYSYNLGNHWNKLSPHNYY